MVMSEMPRPRPGDKLLVITFKTRYQELKITEVTVTKVARYKITVDDPDEPARFRAREFDLRTRAPWDTTPPAKRVGSARATLFTAEQWAYKQRADLGEEYLRSRGIAVWQLQKGLHNAVKEDPLGFVNALRRFEGLEEI